MVLGDSTLETLAPSVNPSYKKSKLQYLDTILKTLFIVVCAFWTKFASNIVLGNMVITENKDLISYLLNM